LRITEALTITLKMPSMWLTDMQSMPSRHKAVAADMAPSFSKGAGLTIIQRLGWLSAQEVKRSTQNFE
jgi:hypothetical protein